MEIAAAHKVFLSLRVSLEFALNLSLLSSSSFVIVHLCFIALLIYYNITLSIAIFELTRMSLNKKKSKTYMVLIEEERPLNS